jgi:hypothetical protein
MKSYAFSALLASCLAIPFSTAHAQDKEEPKADQKANILESGSFEWPPVGTRKLRSAGADVSKAGMNAEWTRFRDAAGGEGGEVVLGLTNELFHSGRQCMFVEFNKATKQRMAAELASDLVPVVPGKEYRVSIWGRMDAKRPLTLAGRVPHLRLRVDWFQADRETQTGDVTWKIQPMPGPQKRPPLFVTSKWNPYWADVKAPLDAAFIKVTWTWETPPKEGETDGVIYFDDVSIEGDPVPKPDPFAETEEEKDQPEEAPAEDAAAPEAPKDPK